MPTSLVKIEFLASDNIGALVEAGVDDLEILDAPKVSNIGIGNGSSGSPPEISLSLSSQPTVRSTGDAANVRFTLPHSMRAEIVLQDLLGNVVQTLGEGIYSGGEHSMTFTPSTIIASGIYILELRTSQGVKSIKVAIL